MSRIDRYMDEWLQALEREASVGKFAQKIGRSHAVFQKTRLGRGPHGFNPTYQLLKDAEAFLGMRAKATHTKTRKAGINTREKAYLPLVSGLEIDRALMLAHEYFEQLRIEHRRLREADIDLGLLGDLACHATGGDVSIHLVAYQPEYGRSYFSRWDAVPDYRGGRDLTGARLDEIGDSSLTSCLHEDFEDVAINGWPLIAALHRRHSWQEDASRANGRAFLRYLCRLEGVDGSPKILSMRSLQVGTAADQLVESVFA